MEYTWEPIRRREQREREEVSSSQEKASRCIRGHCLRNNSSVLFGLSLRVKWRLMKRQRNMGQSFPEARRW